MLKIGVIGNGFVGKATQLLRGDKIEQLVYDNIPDKCVPLGTTMEDINKCDLIFICVPTPMRVDGSCDTSILDFVLSQLSNPCVIIRSTIPIGYTATKNVYFMPEFLTELNWENDFKSCDRWVVGLADNQTEEQHSNFMDLYKFAIENAYDCKSIQYKNVYFTTTKNAEMVKLLANCYLSTKVIFFNEIYDLCSSYGINYEDLVNLLKLDKRIGDSHMSCPGVKGLRGYGGTCFPKDTNNLNTICLSNNVPSIMLESNLWKNELTYRRQKDWLSDYGRTNSKATKPIVLVTELSTPVAFELCKILLQKGNIVVALDTLTDTCKEHYELLQKVAKEFACEKDLYFKNQSVVNKVFLPKVDKIFHLAGLKRDLSAIDAIKIDTIGSLNILELALLSNAEVVHVCDDNISLQSGKTLTLEYANEFKLHAKVIMIDSRHAEKAVFTILNEKTKEKTHCFQFSTSLFFWN